MNNKLKENIFFLLGMLVWGYVSYRDWKAGLLLFLYVLIGTLIIDDDGE